MKRILFILLLFSQVTNAKVTVAPFFSENMVLQRNMPIHIWGYADNKETIRVELNNISSGTKTNQSGKWEVVLPAMNFGGPYELIITGENNIISLKDVLIGDIWICSGQSNMEFALQGSLNSKEEILNSENGNIRFLTIPHNIQSNEQEDILPTSWVKCDIRTSATFSAVGYYFGKYIQRDLDIPIGLINSSLGGTNIETWTSWLASMNNPKFKKYQGENVDSILKKGKINAVCFNKEMSEDKGLREKWQLSAKFRDWQEITLPCEASQDLSNEEGVAWFCKTFYASDSLDSKKAFLNLGAIDDEDITWFNGIKVGENNQWDKLRKYSVQLRKGENTILIRVKNTYAGGGMSAKEGQLFLEVNEKKYSLTGKWRTKSTVLSSQYGAIGTGPNSFASLLYNGMISPLVKFGIKGVIWYQGESNATDAFNYRKLFPIMINDWRQQWGFEFPFYWVQLANYKEISFFPEESDWAELREAQNLTLSLPKTGQAVITDIGDAQDIHPKNKKDVGYRLAQAALRNTYHRNILGYGPAFESMKIQGEKITLNFSNTGDGLSTKDKNRYGYVKGFTISGKDRKFKWAKAYIIGNEVVVFHPEIKKPVAVRYGWSNNPFDDDLVNSDGLLASPFRTDNWKEITQKETFLNQ